MPQRLTFFVASLYRAELERLRAAKPTQIAAFQTSRAARKAELEQILATAEIEPEPFSDPQTEAVLKSSQGGDKFGR